MCGYCNGPGASPKDEVATCAFFGHVFTWDQPRRGPGENPQQRHLHRYPGRFLQPVNSHAVIRARSKGLQTLVMIDGDRPRHDRPDDVLFALAPQVGKASTREAAPQVTIPKRQNVLFCHREGSHATEGGREHAVETVRGRHCAWRHRQKRQDSWLRDGLAFDVLLLASAEESSLGTPSHKFTPSRVERKARGEVRSFVKKLAPLVKWEDICGLAATSVQEQDRPWVDCWRP